MNISLRSKLFALVSLSIVLAAAPMILLAGWDARKNNYAWERRSFANLVLLLEEHIASSQYTFLASIVENILEDKEDLRDLGVSGRSLWLRLDDNEAEESFAVWAASLRPSGISVAVFVDGGPRYGDIHGVAAAIAPDQTDCKGQSFQSLLRASALARDGVFAVFALSAGEALRHPRIFPGEYAAGRDDAPLFAQFAFIPVPWKNGVIVLGMSLQYRDQMRRESEQEIIRNVQRKFDSITMHDDSGFWLLDEEGGVLAADGALAVPRGLAEAIAENASLGDAKGGEELLLPEERGNDVFYRISRFKPLGWYIVGSIPVRSMEESGKELVVRLAAFALFACCAALVPTLALSAALVRPLGVLARKTHDLALADLTVPGAVSAVLGGPAHDASPPSGVKDEVLQLTSAFQHLGGTLDEKIRALVSATAAKERLQGELAAARDIQMGILPPPGSEPGGETWSSAALLVPAKEVGGDFYDFLVSPDGRQALIIGDVSGKGVPAALFMAVAATHIRHALRTRAEPAAIMAELNNTLAEHNPATMFLTLFIGLYDPGSGRLEYANAAHCRPFIVNRAGEVRLARETSGPMVGPLPGMRYTARAIRLAQGETCLLYTDGVTEAMDARKTLFGEERLLECLVANKDGGPGAMIAAVYAAVRAHMGEEAQYDDITMLSIARY